MRPIPTFTMYFTKKLLFSVKVIAATFVVAAGLYPIMCPYKCISDIKYPRHLYDYDNDDDDK